MGLDDLVKDKSTGVGEVSSSMDASDVEMNEDYWQAHAIHNPQDLVWGVDNMDNEQIKYFISLMDKALQEDVYAMNVTEQQKDEIRRYREELVHGLEVTN